MEFRHATASDASAVRSLARASLDASYSSFLSPETIETAVDEWYDDEAFEALVEEKDSTVLVAVDDEPIAFSQSAIVGRRDPVGEIQWLHVHPDHRSGGTGSRLLARTREALLDDGAGTIHGVVLAENEAGNAFYESHGFELAGSRETEIAEETYTENRYVSSGEEYSPSGRQAHEAEGETVYVDFAEPARGSIAPFYTAYETAAGTERYGWYCGECESLSTAMDAMGRIECTSCGNRRKATRWDAAYL